MGDSVGNRNSGNKQVEMKFVILLLAWTCIAVEARVRFETDSLDGQLFGSVFVDDRSDNEGNSSEDNSDEDSGEDDSDIMVLPPGVGERDGLMEGDDPLPTEWTHLNDNNEMDTLHLPPEDDDRSLKNTEFDFS